MSDEQTTTRRPAQTEKGLVAAVRNLTDGVTDLVQSQFELLRLEVKREASEAGRRGGSLLLYSGIALVGYVLLNFAAVLFAGGVFGLWGMAITALALGVVHLAVGLGYVLRDLDAIQEQRERLERKTRSLTGKQSWLEESPEN